MVRSLKDKGANVNILARYDKTPLHFCVINNYLEIAQLLIKEKANIDAKDHKGDTPLYLAVKSDKIEIAELLIKEGANTDVKTNRGLNIASLDKSSLSTEMQEEVDFKERHISLKLGMIANRIKASHPIMYGALKVVNEHRYSFFNKDKNQHSKSGKKRFSKLS